MSRSVFSSISFRAAASLLIFSALTAGEAHAQLADSGPLIVPPEVPQHEGFHGGLGDVAKQTGKSLGEDMETLRKNLGILHDLNSKANQEAINQLGRNYANIDNIGSNLGESIESIDTTQIRDSGDKMVENIQGTMNAYGKTSMDLTSKLAAAIKATPYTAQNPPDKAGASSLGQQAKQMAQDQMQQVLPVLGISYGGVMKLDNNISQMNANVVSITKTYLNLLRLTNQSPSTLTEMSDLPTELATVNNLAGEQMAVLSTLGSSMNVINTNYDNLKKNKLPVKDAVGAINTNISTFNEILSQGNQQMHLSLGDPVPAAPAAPANTSTNSSQ